MAGRLGFLSMIVLVAVSTTRHLDAAEPKINRIPVDDATFAQILQ